MKKLLLMLVGAAVIATAQTKSMHSAYLVLTLQSAGQKRGFWGLQGPPPATWNSMSSTVKRFPKIRLPRPRAAFRRTERCSSRQRMAPVTGTRRSLEASPSPGRGERVERPFYQSDRR